MTSFLDSPQLMMIESLFPRRQFRYCYNLNEIDEYGIPALYGVIEGDRYDEVESARLADLSSRIGEMNQVKALVLAPHGWNPGDGDPPQPDPSPVEPSMPPEIP